MIIIGCFLIGYVDDVAALIIARDVEAVQLRLGQVMCRVRRWMLHRRFDLAMVKTEIVLLTKKRIPRLFSVQVGDVHGPYKGGSKIPRWDVRYEEKESPSRSVVVSHDLGRWTAKLIVELSPWFLRSHVKVVYCLTQMLPGHGLFRSYLHKMGKVGTCGAHTAGTPKTTPYTPFSGVKGGRRAP